MFFQLIPSRTCLSVEVVIQAAADDIVLDTAIDRNPGHIRDLYIATVDIEVFSLGGPLLRESPLNASSCNPSEVRIFSACGDTKRRRAKLPIDNGKAARAI